MIIIVVICWTIMVIRFLFRFAELKLAVSFKVVQLGAGLQAK
jgi:hypothetical protein